MEHEILNCCPFCGSQKLRLCRTNPGACWVKCDKCEAEAPSHAYRGVAITLWNHRIANAPHKAAFVSDDELNT